MLKCTAHRTKVLCAVKWRGQKCVLRRIKNETQDKGTIKNYVMDTH